MAGIHTALTFEEAIEASLLENGGCIKGASKDFDAQLALFPSYIVSFLKDTQPKQWVKLSLHPHNLAQKTDVIIEHFRQVVSKKIGGTAKAMLVTGSRLHAVRYKEEFDKYIASNTDIKTIVAFSGKVIYDLFPEGITEVELNGFKEKELPKKFSSNEYQLLLVADKYQTGFDQPLLHTMYVDKKLSGVRCVQTLSRLNRMHAGKEDTFILDFANETEDILASLSRKLPKMILRIRYSHL